MNVYFTEQGASISLSGQRLVLTKNGVKINEIHAKDISQIIIMGNINLTIGAIKFLLKNKIDTVFTTSNGKYLGRLEGELGKNIELRKKQFSKCNNEDFKLEIAKRIVFAKIYNSRQILRKFNYYHKSKEVTHKLHKLTSIIDTIPEVNNKEKLLGIEGNATSIYFECFDYLITNEELKFVKRTRRPPKNEFNALLSFGYMLLMNIVRGCINIVGLDPYLGIYHSDYYGRPSLVLDLMEEFRSVIVDYVTIRAVNQRIFSRDDFISTEDDEMPVRLTVFGKRKLISIFEKRLNDEMFYSQKNVKTTLRKIILEQVYELSKCYTEDNKFREFKMQ